jgi:hypothetical protein
MDWTEPYLAAAPSSSSHKPIRCWKENRFPSSARLMLIRAGQSPPLLSVGDKARLPSVVFLMDSETYRTFTGSYHLLPVKVRQRKHEEHERSMLTYRTEVREVHFCFSAGAGCQALIHSTRII